VEAGIEVRVRKKLIAFVLNADIEKEPSQMVRASAVEWLISVILVQNRVLDAEQIDKFLVRDSSKFVPPRAKDCFHPLVAFGIVLETVSWLREPTFRIPLLLFLAVISAFGEHRDQAQKYDRGCSHFLYPLLESRRPRDPVPHGHRRQYATCTYAAKGRDGGSETLGEACAPFTMPLDTDHSVE